MRTLSFFLFFFFFLGGGGGYVSVYIYSRCLHMFILMSMFMFRYVLIMLCSYVHIFRLGL